MNHNRGEHLVSSQVASMQNIEPYERLANAIVVQACTDYRFGRISDSQMERFCHSQWYQLLTNVDGGYILNRLRESKNDRKRTKRRN